MPGANKRKTTNLNEPKAPDGEMLDLEAALEQLRAIVMGLGE